jgi:N-methylhydantoinase B
VRYHRFALREGSGGAGAQRGGFGVHYEVELLRGDARASFVMDHGRFGPPGVLGGVAGAPNVVRIHRNGTVTIPEHLSKDQGIPMQAGDRVEVMTPGGGGYGDPKARDPAAVARDVRLGYYSREEALELFGVALRPDGEVDEAETERPRDLPIIPEAEPQARLSGTSREESEPASRDPGSERRSPLGHAAPSGMTGASK